MRATIFVTISYGLIAGKSYTFSAREETAEECLLYLNEKLHQHGVETLLTFRPADGMIFGGDISTTVPIGVVYQRGYQDHG